MNNNLNELRLASGEKGTVIEAKKNKIIYEEDIICTVYAVRDMAVRAGFEEIDEIMIATAASELATNILRYAGEGKIEFNIIKNNYMGKEYVGIELLASDNGPGIENLECALQEQYSSMPFSLGLGLPSVKRIADEFYIESIVGKGTRVLARKWKLVNEL